jgi:prenyltransferase beta subunit
MIRRLGNEKDIGSILRTILGLRASGRDPRDAGGRDLVAELAARQKPSGSFAGYTSFTTTGIFALVATGETAGLGKAVRWLVKQQNRDGGFPLYRRGGPSSTDDTAPAVEALVAAGNGGSEPVRRAIAYLRRTQRKDGGWPLTRGAPTNAQSTAFGLLAFAAAEQSGKPARRARAYLARLQRPDGSVRYSKTSDQTPVWVTAQALLAFAGSPLPVVAKGQIQTRENPFTTLLWD